MMLVLAGFVAGFVHVLSGPDHLAAIAPYAVEAKRRAWRTGVRWGLGHAAGVFGVGLVVLLLRDAFPVEAVSAWGERLVGFVLIGIGALGCARGAWARARQPRADGTHIHGHKAFAVGTLHGARRQRASSRRRCRRSRCLLISRRRRTCSCSEQRSVAAMGTFALLVGWVAARPGASGPRAQGALLGISSVIAVAIGGYWLSGVA